MQFVYCTRLGGRLFSNEFEMVPTGLESAMVSGPIELACQMGRQIDIGLKFPAGLAKVHLNRASGMGHGSGNVVQRP